MSNEEKILSMLTEMQADMKIMQSDINTIKNGGVKKIRPNAREQIAILDAMSSLLTQEEKDALGRYQKAEEARKRALYG